MYPWEHPRMRPDERRIRMRAAATSSGGGKGEEKSALAERTVFIKPHEQTSSGFLSNRGDWVHATLDHSWRKNDITHFRCNRDWSDNSFFWFLTCAMGRNTSAEAANKPPAHGISRPGGPTVCGRRSRSSLAVLGAEMPPWPAGVLPSRRCASTSFLPLP